MCHLASHARSVFVKFKLIFSATLDGDDEDITMDGTLSLRKDLGVDPENIILLAVACELQSLSVDRWRLVIGLEGAQVCLATQIL